MSDKLPSIDDFYEELPSIDEIIKEEKELPSVDEFVEKEEEEIPDTAPCSIEEEVEPQDLTEVIRLINCLLYTSPSPRDRTRSRMPSSA